MPQPLSAAAVFAVTGMVGGAETLVGLGLLAVLVHHALAVVIVLAGLSENAEVPTRLTQAEALASIPYRS
jgi:hypothetical protein